MQFDAELSYDDFKEWDHDEDMIIDVTVEAEGFRKGDHGRRGHPDNWEPPTYDEVEEIWVYHNGVDIAGKLTQSAIDRLKGIAWDEYWGTYS